MQTIKPVSPKAASRPVVADRIPYEKPKLVLLGDVRGLTLGPSVGVSESGLNRFRRFSPDPILIPGYPVEAEGTPGTSEGSGGIPGFPY